jgi:hypothetical protein
MWAIQRLKALRALRRPYRRTEVWLLLEPGRTGRRRWRSG